jgi:hypothetical protein
MIVSLEVLKRALEIEASDTSDDELLADLEARAGAWVEAQTERRWGVPEERTEIIVPKGGSRFLRLTGHVHDADDVVTLRRRAIYGGIWEEVEAEEFERRDDLLVHLNGRWPRGYEYEVTYDDGWPADALPKDIEELIIDLVGIAYAGMGEEGVKSESIGDYSYTLDSAVTMAASSLSDTSAATLNRRRHVHIA